MNKPKFRAWDKKYKIMRIVSEINFDHEKVFCKFAELKPFDLGSELAFRDIILMQYTGLKDKNGVEIYEGDYIRCKQYVGGNFVDYHYETGYVDVKTGAFGLHREQGYYRPFRDWFDDYEFEVLGNIHENPELLSEVEK